MKIAIKDKLANGSESTSKDHADKKPQRWAVESAIFFLYFAHYLMITVLTNQVLKQTCLYTFKYDYNICNQLDNKNTSASVEQEIQPYVAKILMTTSIINAIIPTAMSLLLGPWSDKHGRKKVLNGIFIGASLTMGSITIITYLSEYYEANNPWIYLFAQLPFMLFGGWPTLLIVTMCYLTDQTDETTRSTRFSILELITFVGILIAVAASSFLLKLTNVTTVFSVAFGCIMIGTIIMLFFVEESNPVKDDDQLMVKLKDLFSPVRIKELFETFVQQRPFKQRRILWFLTIILMLMHIANNGPNTILYLFVRHKFGWNLQDLTLYVAATMLMTVGGSIFGLVVLKKLLKFSDLSMSTISLTSLMIDVIIKVFANQSWQLYVASGTAIFRLLSGSMLRSIMSSIVPKNEISKFYSITSCIEAISGLGAAPLYTATYTATLLAFPSAFNLISVALFALTLVLIFSIARLLSPFADKTVDTKL